MEDKDWFHLDDECKGHDDGQHGAECPAITDVQPSSGIAEEIAERWFASEIERAEQERAEGLDIAPLERWLKREQSRLAALIREHFTPTVGEQERRAVWDEAIKIVRKQAWRDHGIIAALETARDAIPAPSGYDQRTAEESAALLEKFIESECDADREDGDFEINYEGRQRLYQVAATIRALASAKPEEKDSHGK